MKFMSEKCPMPLRGQVMRGVLFAVTAVVFFWVVVADAEELSDRYVVDIHKRDQVSPGTTIFADTRDRKRPLLVEVDMEGKVVWTYEISPDTLGRGRLRGGLDVEWIPETDNILATLPGKGVIEVNRNGKIVWSYEAPASHDADRLRNGNTLMVWAWGEDSSDPEVREVDNKGNVVWKWHAKEHLGDLRPLRKRKREGYTHANSVVRLENGNTLISLRNFYMLVEVDPSGKIVWKLENLFVNPHDPEVLANGNILVNTRRPQVIKEYSRSGEIVWSYTPDQAQVDTVRYNHRLANGNTIFAERTKIIEISPSKEIVWQLRLKDIGRTRRDRNAWFYKAERIPLRR